MADCGLALLILVLCYGMVPDHGRLLYLPLNGLERMTLVSSEPYSFTSWLQLQQNRVAVTVLACWVGTQFVEYNPLGQAFFQQSIRGIREAKWG